ncbi:nephrin-like isoform X2 [Rhodnius prolixus]|uniref:nephrin-like isoform X2 n=1 Tax=Rhodnius prolixus TaxID=13249 RepID=UPI003D18C304
MVQWTKDGFALGFASIIPGYARYSMVGDSRNGVFNLRVVNASLEDDADFQCQVGPKNFHKAIRANARLSVISPPSSIEMVGHAANSKIEIKENEEFTLECLVKNSKPAAKIVWYRGDVEIKLDKREDKVTEIELPSKKAKRYNVSSKIRLQPTFEDDYADYTCEARHEALPPDMPLRVTVQLSVLYPPGLPYIEGYTDGETIRRGQTVELVCRSRGGNPPAQLIWYKNGEQIRMAYRTAGRLSENIYTFTADASDNKAKYRCEASNIMSPAPLKAEVDLTVLFAPAQVTISGPTEARVGDAVPLTCTTASSNPPADIKWTIGGRQVRNATQRTVTAPEGGWVTTSNTTAVMAPEQRSLVVICHGLNKQLTENIVSTHTINVLYPPGHPIISGYTKGAHIAAGTVQKISCISSGGNPLATLTWYKNDKKINSATKVTEKSVSSEITILANVTDNEAIYKCEASNPATEIPLFETVQLSVHFPPEHVRIRKEPEELRAGTIATLTCDGSSSNPPAEMSWWREGISVTDGITNTSKPGLHGGVVSSIQLRLNVTPEIDGDMYTCQASNTALQRSVHDAITMSVLYKPMFSDPDETELTGVEGQSMVIAPQATGHPSTISYTWTKDKAPLSSSGHGLHVEGPLLNFTRLDRTHSGAYTCEAVNSEGSSTVTFNITVQYPASIVEISEGVSVAPEKDAELWCRLDGSPLSPEHVTWRRSDYPDMLHRTTVTWRNGTSYLTVHSASREDIGFFQCAVHNGLGNESTKNIFLIVEHKPEMDLSPALSKSASNSGETGRLTCRVSAAPAVNFTWSRDGSVITTDHHKYLIEYKKIDDVHYESVVLIRNIELSDYGRYECMARNMLGFATQTVRLSVTTVPDPPTDLAVYNVSHDSLTLGWKPGFDGGLPATYRLRYRPATSSGNSGGPPPNYRYEDTGNATRYVVTGLELATQYVFSVMAQNRLGASRYLPDTLKATTSSVAPPSLPSRGSGGASSKGSSGLLIVLGTGFGFILLLMNLVLVACCLRRRSSRLASAKRMPGASEQGSNKSATIEMYAPSSYNETVTGETLSSVSEKSESYSDQQDYNDDARKPAASTYLIDQVEYPFQYPGYDIQHQMKELEPIGLHRNNTYNQNGEFCEFVLGVGVGVPSCGSTGLEGYYTVGGDPRYVAYPPPVQFAGPPLSVPPTVPPLPAPTSRTVPPPDVTVLSAPPLLSTFNYNAGSQLDTDSHLV